uniref:Uncharacterized protein n=1 Tax=Anguilla anguilla TaxID=7936 RepID=A0A0E9W9A6_ANGAN
MKCRWNTGAKCIPLPKVKVVSVENKSVHFTVSIEMKTNSVTVR